jgi:hypothetical protein
MPGPAFPNASSIAAPAARPTIATLLTVILADGINLGLTRMAETCQGATLRQLAHLHDWHISEAAYGEALGRLIDAHRAMPLAALWGDGTTSSSDGQLFHAGARGRDRRHQRAQRQRTRRQLLHPCLGSI